ncbi:phosphonate ABC transporter, permease protein PhnE [Plantactinospora endophytica]|uniref:Phosphate-import permease protein PhnE n=1 Tax=Plantactinospora endophytica TaxID=673535 RepID=A0ABQ4E7H1_9ACTN|nr:phosphonate ABC transporter, permease protein PhnE [Plantactinospora endophytica]GIG90669.1 phosphate-import permease protein PhnE [Plantactinospora endophytica]
MTTPTNSAERPDLATTAQAEPTPAGAATDKRALRPPWTRNRIVGLAAAAGAVLAIVVSTRQVGVDPQRLIDGWADLGNLLGRMLPVEMPQPSRVVGPILDTLMMAVAGTALALLLSLPLSFLAAANTAPSPAVRAVARAIILGARSIPDLVYALIFVRVLGVGVLPGVLAVAIYSTGMIGKLFADAIEEVDDDVHHAVATVGATRLQAIMTGVVPQVLPSFVSTTLYRLDMNVAASAVLGFVGAGGIGFELYNTLRTLQYQRGLGLALIIIALVVIVERISAAIRASILAHEHSARERRRSRRPARDRPPATGRPRLSPPWTRARLTRQIAVLSAAGLALVSFAGLGISPGALLRAIPELVASIGTFLPPDFASVRDDLGPAIVETLTIAVCATALATALSLPIAFLAARPVAPHPVVYHAARLVIVLSRGLPPLVLALIFVSAFGLGPFAGVIALGLGSIGLTAKLMADAIEHLDPGPRAALRSVGATRVQQATTGVVPQVAPSFVATTLFTLDSTIRSSTIVGIVGAGGIGFITYQSVHTLQFHTTAAVLIVIFVTVFVVERFSDMIRKRIL